MEGTMNFKQLNRLIYSRETERDQTDKAQAKELLERQNPGHDVRTNPSKLSSVADFAV
jgi:hypothetical protein